MNDSKNISFLAVREMTFFKQTFFGMLCGMGKQAISRLESGNRQPTAVHKELLSFISYLCGKNLLSDYIRWRFDLNISSRFFKKSTPLVNKPRATNFKMVNLMDSGITIKCGNCGERSEAHLWDNTPEGQALPQEQLQCPRCEVLLKKVFKKPSFISYTDENNDDHFLEIHGKCNIVEVEAKPQD